MDIIDLESQVDLSLESSILFFLDYLEDSFHQQSGSERLISVASDIAKMENGSRTYKFSKYKLIAVPNKNKLEITCENNGKSFGLAIYHHSSWPLFYAPLIGKKHEEGAEIGLSGERLGYAIRVIDKTYFHLLEERNNGHANAKL